MGSFSPSFHVYFWPQRQAMLYLLFVYHIFGASCTPSSKHQQSLLHGRVSYVDIVGFTSMTTIPQRRSTLTSTHDADCKGTYIVTTRSGTLDPWFESTTTTSNVCAGLRVQPISTKETSSLTHSCAQRCQHPTSTSFSPNSISKTSRIPG